MPAARAAGRSDTASRGLLADTLFAGFYPPIHDREVDPADWVANDYRTYVERDVRGIVNVGDLEAFGRFVRLVAGRSGQLVNFSAIAADCGISHTTARRWLSILETSFLVLTLPPYHRSFKERLVKSSKVHFLDTGLLCYLLGIRSPNELETHAARGAVFESYVVAELHKTAQHSRSDMRLSFWRDSAGHEVDVVVEIGARAIPIEAKSGKTVASDALRGLDYWRRLAGEPEGPAILVHGGDQTYRRGGATVLSWGAF